MIWQSLPQRPDHVIWFRRIASLAREVGGQVHRTQFEDG